jgi:hypothetical protein
MTRARPGPTIFRRAWPDFGRGLCQGPAATEVRPWGEQTPAMHPRGPEELPAVAVVGMRSALGGALDTETEVCRMCAGAVSDALMKAALQRAPGPKA